VHIRDWIEEDNKVWDNPFSFSDLRSEKNDFVGQSARQPLVANVITLTSHTLSSLANGMAQIRACSNKDYSSIFGCDRSHDLGGTTEER